MCPSIDFIPGRKKGSRNVLYNGHLYHLNRKKDDKTYWHYASLGRQTTSTLSISQITSLWTEPSGPLQTYLLSLLKSSQSMPYTLLDGESLQPLDSYPGSRPSSTNWTHTDPSTLSRCWWTMKSLSETQSATSGQVLPWEDAGSTSNSPCGDTCRERDLLLTTLSEKPSCGWELSPSFLSVMWTWPGSFSNLSFLLRWLLLPDTLSQRELEPPLPLLYDHDSWNHHEASQMLPPRSSNVAEGWNRWKGDGKLPSPFHLEILGVYQEGASPDRHEDHQHPHQKTFQESSKVRKVWSWDSTYYWCLRWLWGCYWFSDSCWI